MDPLARLSREDKWFLGGGKGALWAPPFPKHLYSFGYWDESYLADVRLQHLFTTILLDARARPIRFRSEHAGWRPDRLELIHTAPGITIRETRCILENHSWVSELSLETGPGELDLFLWSLQDLRPPGYGTPWSSLVDCTVSSDSIGFRWGTAWPSELEPDRTAVEAEQIASGGQEMLRPLSVSVELGADRERISQTVNLAQRHDDSPLWETSVLPEKFRDGRLAGDFKLRAGPGEPEGLVHLVQHYRLTPGERIQFIASAGLSAGAARSSFEETRSLRAAEESEAAWKRYFASVPHFESSDPWLTSAYWYRWYGLRLNTVDMPDLPICRGSAFQAESASGFQPESGQDQEGPERRGPALPTEGASGFQPESGQDLEGPGTLGLEGQATFSPFVTEGIGFFRNFVTYSAQAHLREAVWMHDPRLAVGILENLGKCQRADGSFPGHNYSCRPGRDFYHTDFTTGLHSLKSLHGEEAAPAETWPTLERYADYFLKNRAQRFLEHRALLFLVLDQNETGQEYMSRYTAIRSDSDQWASFQVCGIDASVYISNLLASLAAHFYGPPFGQSPKDKEKSDRYWGLVHQVRHGLTELSWDPERRFFCDVRMDGSRTDAHPATGLYPSGSGMAFLIWHNAGLELDGMLRDWLENPSKFNLPKGFPADSADDPTFSPEAEWKDKRLNCPWSGRSWPMVNSHLVDCAAHFARVWSHELPLHEEGLRLKRTAGEALMKAIKLMFHDGDPSRPNSYEHYNPITGMPALYRGYDDYMHSWIVDLIMRHVVGVQPGMDEVDPLPLDIDWIECRDIPHPKGRMHVRIDRGQRAQVSIEEVS